MRTAERREDASAKAMWAEQERARLRGEAGQAAIPARFIGKTPGQLQRRHRGQAVRRHRGARLHRELRAAPKRGDGLILSGMPGTGKSHIAAAILQGILPKHVGLYMTCMGAIRAVRETWRKDSERSEREVLNILGDACRCWCWTRSACSTAPMASRPSSSTSWTAATATCAQHPAHEPGQGRPQDLHRRARL
jgi:hypothetical protein